MPALITDITNYIGLANLPTVISEYGGGGRFATPNPKQ